MKLLQRMDDWMNTITGLNILGRDKRVSTLASADILGEAEVEEIYASDDIAAKIIDMPAEDMVREGFKLVVPSFSEKKLRAVNEYLEAEMNWKPLFKQALAWADLYGGSALWLGVDDRALRLSDPLNLKSIRKFSYAHVLNRYELQWQAINGNAGSRDCGLPSIYHLQPQYGTDDRAFHIAQIHASRLIRFDGVPLPRRLFIQNGYWGDSVLSKLKGPLMNYGQTHDSVASLMADFCQAVFKVKGMDRLMTAKDGKNLLKDRLEMMDYSRSVIRAIMIDAEEEFGRESVQLSGVAEILDKMGSRLVTASKLPHTVLLGTGPAGGLSESGKSELIDYYNFIARKQETILKPALRRFIQLVFLSRNGPTFGSEPAKWDIEFNPLWQEPLKDILERQEKQSRIDDTYIKNRVLTSNEVTRSRFGSGVYSHDTALDFERPLATEEDTADPVEDGQDEESNNGEENSNTEDGQEEQQNTGTDG